VPAVITASAGRDWGHRIAKVETRCTVQHRVRASLNIVARQPRFAHDAVKAVPHSDG
jgi:hypothetical protein